MANTFYNKFNLLLGAFLWFGLPALEGYSSSQMLTQVKKLGRNSRQSILFVRLSDKKVLFEKNRNLSLIPASVTKLLTSAAILDYFNPVYQFETKIYLRGPMKDGVLTGDLVIVGDGDPMLVSEKLWQTAADLRNMGLKRITGDLVIDTSLFDGIRRDGSRKSSVNSSNNAYDAPISAFGVNFNTMAIVASPGNVGAKANVSFDPYSLPGVRLDNRVTTTKSGKSKIKVSRLTSASGREQFTASGTISKDDKIKKIYRSVGIGWKVSGQLLKAFLREDGIEVDGNPKLGQLKGMDKLFYSIASYPLRKQVSGLNNFSNNYIADVLIKRMGAGRERSDVGSMKNGMKKLSSFLKDKAGVSGDFILRNGSGLSVENMLSAQQVVDVLTYVYSRMDLFPDFLASLPASGWDGTLKKRFRGFPGLEGKVRAKTGTLTNPVSVAGLGGYLKHKVHGMVAFCVINNGIRGKAQPGIEDLRHGQDKLVDKALKTL